MLVARNLSWFLKNDSPSSICDQTTLHTKEQSPVDLVQTAARGSILHELSSWTTCCKHLMDHYTNYICPLVSCVTLWEIKAVACVFVFEALTCLGYPDRIELILKHVSYIWTEYLLLTRTWIVTYYTITYVLYINMHHQYPETATHHQIRNWKLLPYSTCPCCPAILWDAYYYPSSKCCTNTFNMIITTQLMFTKTTLLELYLLLCTNAHWLSLFLHHCLRNIPATSRRGRAEMGFTHYTHVGIQTQAFGMTRQHFNH